MNPFAALSIVSFVSSISAKKSVYTATAVAPPSQFYFSFEGEGGAPQSLPDLEALGILSRRFIAAVVGGGAIV